MDMTVSCLIPAWHEGARIASEAAKNTNVSGRLNRPVSPSFMFAPSVGRPDPRGY